VIIHPTISTKGMEESQMMSLIKKTFDTIESGIE